MAADQWAVLEISRDAGDATNDTNTGGANLAFVEFCYEVDNLNSGE